MVNRAARLDGVAAALAPLLEYVELWDGIRLDPEVCDLAFGNPQELPLPGFVAAIREHAKPLDKDWFAYKRSEPEPRAAVAKALREARGVPFDPEDIALTPGAFGALATAFRLLLDPGDEVVFSLPPWFLYEAMLLAADAVPVKVRVRPDDHDLDVDAIAAAIGPRTKAVIVNTPHNPTGRIYPPATLTRLADVLEEASDRLGRTIWLISDEPYNRLVFSDAEFHSPCEVPEHASPTATGRSCSPRGSGSAGWQCRPGRWTRGTARCHPGGADRRRLGVSQRHVAACGPRPRAAVHRPGRPRGQAGPGGRRH